MRTNGDGSYTISKGTTVTLGLALTLVILLVGAVSYASGQNQLFTSHIENQNAHWSTDTLAETFMPRGELNAKLDEILRRLTRIEQNTRGD